MAAKSKLGQNFLRDRTAIDRIVAALGDLTDRTVVEIGPGEGAITQAILSKAPATRLIAVEFDRQLAAPLARRFSAAAGFPSVTVQRQDILEFDFRAIGGEPVPPGTQPQRERSIVVGNLPYYITSPILLHLAASAEALSHAVLMVQREVADRVTAQPGSRDYGLLSATVQLYGRAESLFTLPPEAFEPPPEVHSTVFRWVFAPRFEELGVEAKPFVAFLRQMFAQKRKTLSNNLRAAGYQSSAISQALDAAHIPAQARAETLDLTRFASLWRTLAGARPTETPAP